MPTLLEINKGEEAIISVQDLEHVPLKLIELGFVEETEVKLVDKAPLGDPLILKVNGNLISIRKELAKKIKIELA